MQAYDFKKAKEEYREFCKTEPTIWIYIQPWFLDAVIEDGQEWRVILVKDNQGTITGAFPFAYEKRKGFWYIFQPWQCAHMGLWLDCREELNERERFLWELKITEAVIDHLPYFDSFCICFHESYQWWQSFYWHGFKATAFYNMTLSTECLKDWDHHPTKSRRKCIRRAKRNLTIQKEQLSPEEYWSFLEQSYASRNRICSYTREQFLRLIKEVEKRMAYHVYTATDLGGHPGSLNLV